MTAPRPALAARAPAPSDLLRARPNPGVRHDYLVRLGGSLDHPATGAVALTLHYVPDRLIADAAGFAAYLEALGGARLDSLEALAARAIDDVSNAKVPRWARVTATADAAAAGGAHAVLVEDSQPGWSNDPLLSVLAPF